MDPVLSAPLLAGNGAIQEVSQAPSVRHNTELNKSGSSLLRQLSGKWQFKFEKFIREGAFHDAEDLGEGRREYNRKQREILSIFDEFSAPVTSRNEEGRENIAVNISNIANVFILLFKVYATLRTHSLAVAASTLDSLLDLLAGAILWFTQFSVKRTNIYKYPIGKLRVQPVGIIVFSAVMATLGLQILITSVEQLFEGNPHNQLTSKQIIWLVAILGTAFVLKLGLFLYCRSFENEIVQAYSMDHYFDVITNIAGLAAALLANRFYWWIDPVGAIGLAVYTIVNWSKTVFENAVSLIGKSAPPEVLQKLTYMAFTHHPDIKRIDTVRAYTFGALYFVEVDIELPEDMPLRVAHDIGESLQIKFEALPEVERAFVHLDFECTHKPEHESGIVFDN